MAKGIGMEDMAVTTAEGGDFPSLLFIGGRWTRGSSDAWIDVENPATGRVFHRVAAATTEDVDLAVRNARHTFDTGRWSHTSGAERGAYLRAIAARIREERKMLARAEVLDNGKPLSEALWDIDDAAGCFEYYADLAEELDRTPPETIDLQDARFSCSVVREPVGVAGAIIPWNYPLLMAAWKVAPALAAGCTVVLKPSEVTSITSLLLARICEYVALPAGVLNVLTGLGDPVGRAICEHPKVDKLAFTGSVSTGRSIMTMAAHDIKRVSLELGGKSPLLVFDDADIERAVEWIMFGIFWNKGEVCSATSRVLVQKGIYDQLLARLVTETEKIRIGPGLEKGSQLGPLVSKLQFEKVTAAIEQARRDGAIVLTGGRRARATGYFLQPTILVDVPLDSAAWTEEIFGPVLCIQPFGSESEAIERANDSRFGLAAAVITADEQRLQRVGAALRAGIVWLNCSQPTFPQAPWGGVKQSGIGRELGRWGLDNYLEVKQITRYISDAPWGWFS